MKFSLGDAVWLRQTEEEGSITAFLSKTLYEVEVGGVRFPVFADSLEHPYLRRFQKTGIFKKEEVPLPAPEKTPPPRLPQGCYFSFLPVYKEEAKKTNEIDAVKLYLVNELPDSLRFDYDLRTAGKASFFGLVGNIPAYSNLYLHMVPWEIMAAQPRFHWRLQPTFDGRMGPQQEGVFSLRARQLVQRISALEESGSPAFSELLVDQFVEAPALPLPQLKAVSVPENTLVAKPFSPVIDLHASVLLSGAEDYLPMEIFRTQLDVLHRFLEEAIAHKTPHLTLIHGVGNGVLRRAVTEILQTHREAFRITHDWHPCYGFGATGVKMKYK